VDAGRPARAGILVAAARELVDGAGASGLARDVQEVEASLAREGGQPVGVLSPRELDVLRRVAAGASNDDVALALGISVRTVEVHVGHVMHKLGVPSRGGAVAAGIRRGILEEDDLRAGG
jgi:DNA-binding CsgD family transcriptional regulator